MASHLLQGGPAGPDTGSFRWSFWTTIAVHGVLAVVLLFLLLIGLGVGVPVFAGIEVLTLVVACVRAARGRRRGAAGVLVGAAAVVAGIVLFLYAVASSVGG